MKKETAGDLVVFLVVAREQSFTRAAAQLGVSQSALSQTLRGLEARLGIRLLTRTTRRVAPTEAGERLLRTVGPRFAEVDAELESVTALRDKAAGTIRLTSTENAAASVLWPALERFLPVNCALKPRHNESVTWPFSEATCQIIGCVYFRRRSRRMSSDVWSLARPWRRFRRNWGLPGSYCMNGVGRGVAMAQPV